MCSDNDSGLGELNQTEDAFDPAQLPAYSGEPYCSVHGNIPYFTEDEMTDDPFENYSELDKQGRCGIAYACLGKENMPPEGDFRGDINHVYPSGWTQDEYDCIEDERDDNGSRGYLFNRCHMIAWCLSDEDDNKLNLITGTRYMNVDGMWPFESQVQNYILRTGNHCMYRVTPVFGEYDQVCSGVLLECRSVEDGGAGLQFCVYCYNVQPGIEIDYSTGENWYTGVFADPDASSVIMP